MSAFFLAINRDGRNFDPSLAERMLDTLDPYGPDGRKLHVAANFALGYQRRWNVPEEQGEQQPLYDAEHDLWLMWHGRIDNREALLASMASSDSMDSTDNPDDTTISDAALLMTLYVNRGEACFKEIVGPFAFAIFQPSNSRLIAARDCLGGRSLFFFSSADVLLLATWELALAAHPQLGYRFNHAKVLRIIAGMMDDVPGSTLAGASPLEPGQQLTWSGRQISFDVFYRPDPNRRISLPDEQAYATEFRRLFDQAVKRRLRGSKPIGVMLSGGHDSVPIAISAAQQLARADQQLRSFSWVFDQTPHCDERYISSEVCRDFDIQPDWVNCDQVWPQFDDTMYRNPLLPISSPYVAFAQALFERAQDRGVGILLSGMGGDLLYTGAENTAWEMLASGRLRAGLMELWTRFRARRSLRIFLRQFVLGPILPGLFEARRLSRPPVVAFFRSGPQHMLQHMVNFLSPSMWAARRPTQYANVLGTLEGEDAGYARYFETAYRIERRYPFRDRDLVEFMLAIPSEQLNRAECTRPIVKSAFANEFHKALAERNDKTDFSAVIRAGIAADQHYQGWMQREDSSWQDFVNKRYLDELVDECDTISHLKWRCGYYEYWKTMCYTPLAKRIGLPDAKTKAQ